MIVNIFRFDSNSHYFLKKMAICVIRIIILIMSSLFLMFLLISSTLFFWYILNRTFDIHVCNGAFCYILPNDYLFYSSIFLFVSAIASSLLLLYTKYKSIEKNYKEAYIPYREFTKEQKNLIPKIKESLAKCAFLRMRTSGMSVNEIIKSLKVKFAKNDEYKQFTEQLISQVLFFQYDFLGRRLTVLEWYDYLSELRMIELSTTIEEYLTDKGADELMDTLWQIKKFFIEQVKHGVYDEDIIIDTISHKFWSKLSILEYRDRIDFENLIPKLKFTENEDSYSLHEWLNYYKNRKPKYIEGNLF